MEQKLRKALYRLAEGDGGILCAVSGGLDSMVLLHGLYELSGEMGFSLYAAHYNHGLRESAARDEAFVRAECDILGIPLTVGRGDVLHSLEGRTVEEAAREMRYAFLEETRAAAGCSLIAVAHHSGDQAETVLLNLLRGAGVRGLRGMEERRGRIIRPMLDITREEIREYAERKGIRHMEDESNEDTRYRRNRIRKELIPLLQREYNPAIIKALCATARAAGEDEAYLSRAAAERLSASVIYHHSGYGWVLDKTVLDEPALAKRILRLCLEDLGVWDVDGAMLSSILKEGAQGRQDIGHGVYLERKKEIQIYRPVTYAEESGFTGGTAQLSSLGLTAKLEGDTIGYVLRTRRPGDRLGSGKLLADAMKERGIPRCIRDSLGVIVKDGTVCGVEYMLTEPELVERHLCFCGNIWKRQGGNKNE